MKIAEYRKMVRNIADGGASFVEIVYDRGSYYSGRGAGGSVFEGSVVKVIDTKGDMAQNATIFFEIEGSRRRVSYKKAVLSNKPLKEVTTKKQPKTVQPAYDMFGQKFNIGDLFAGSTSTHGSTFGVVTEYDGHNIRVMEISRSAQSAGSIKNISQTKTDKIAARAAVVASLSKEYRKLLGV